MSFSADGNSELRIAMFYFIFMKCIDKSRCFPFYYLGIYGLEYIYCVFIESSTIRLHFESAIISFFAFLEDLGHTFFLRCNK